MDSLNVIRLDDYKSDRYKHTYERYNFVYNEIKNKKLLSILDVGCGNGIGMNILKSKGITNICGIEIDNSIQSPNIINMDIMQYSLKSKFDIIICFDLLGFDSIKSDVLLLKKLYSIMNYNSKLYLSTVIYDAFPEQLTFKKKYYKRIYNFESLQTLLNHTKFMNLKYYGQVYPSKRTFSVQENLFNLIPFNPNIPYDFCLITGEK